MFDDLTKEQEEMIKKNIEAFKIKIHWELDNYNDDHILIFGNDRIATTSGDMRMVVFRLACMIDQMSEQSGMKRKEIVKGIKECFKMVDYAKENRED